VWVVNSGINEVVEKAGKAGLQGVLLGLEELRLGLASLAALWRVAVVGVVRDGHILAGLVEFVGEGIRVQSRLLVIDKVLQVVRVAALLGEAQEDHRFGHKDAALGSAGWQVAVDLGVAVVERFHLGCEDAPAVLGTHREEPPPDILAVAAGPELKCPIACEFRVPPSYRLLHRARNGWEGIAARGGHVVTHALLGCQ